MFYLLFIKKEVDFSFLKKKFSNSAKENCILDRYIFLE